MSASITERELDSVRSALAAIVYSSLPEDRKTNAINVSLFLNYIPEHLVLDTIEPADQNWQISGKVVVWFEHASNYAILCDCSGLGHTPQEALIHLLHAATLSVPGVVAANARNDFRRVAYSGRH